MTSIASELDSRVDRSGLAGNVVELLEQCVRLFERLGQGPGITVSIADLRLAQLVAAEIARTGRDL